MYPELAGKEKFTKAVGFANSWLKSHTGISLREVWGAVQSAWAHEQAAGRLKPHKTAAKAAAPAEEAPKTTPPAPSPTT